MLERENIDNFIADDLALRNRNWGQIEDELDARYTKDETEGLLAGKADLTDSLRLKNLITNGDFSQGTTGWAQNGGVLEVVFDSQLNKNVMEVTSDSQSYPGAIQGITTPEGSSRFYITALLKRVSGTGTGAARPYIGVGPSAGAYSDSSEYIRISTVHNTNQSALLLLAGNAIGITAVVRFADVVVLNLTQIFGAGNEPTKEEMDKLIDLLGGWFDGEIEVPQKTLASWLLNDIRLKADKQQEEWITPTLMNGAVSPAGQEVQFMKDSLGFVHLRGRIGGAGGQINFMLVPECRPDRDLRFFIAAEGTAVSFAVVQSNGRVYTSDLGSQHSVLDGVVFRAGGAT